MSGEVSEEIPLEKHKLEFFTIDASKIIYEVNSEYTIKENNVLQNNFKVTAASEVNISTRQDRRFYDIKYQMKTPYEYKTSYNYLLEKNGQMNILPSKFDPAFRNIPILPEEEIYTGYGWNEAAFKVAEFPDNSYGKEPKPYIYPINIYYRYNGITKFNNQDVHYISFSGIESFNNGLPILYSEDTTLKRQEQRGEVSIIMGEIKGKLFYSVDKMITLYYELFSNNINIYPDGSIKENIINSVMTVKSIE